MIAIIIPEVGDAVREPGAEGDGEGEPRREADGDAEGGSSGAETDPEKGDRGEYLEK